MPARHETHQGSVSHCWWPSCRQAPGRHARQTSACFLPWIMQARCAMPVKTFSIHGPFQPDCFSSSASKSAPESEICRWTVICTFSGLSDHTENRQHYTPVAWRCCGAKCKRSMPRFKGMCGTQPPARASNNTRWHRNSVPHHPAYYTLPHDLTRRRDACALLTVSSTPKHPAQSKVAFKECKVKRIASSWVKAA